MDLTEDFYGTSDDAVTRRVTMLTVDPRLQIDVMQMGDVVKNVQRFTANAIARNPPRDELYTYPKTRILCSSTDYQALGNFVVDCVSVHMGSSVEVRVNESRCRITILLPGGLDLKVKLFKWGRGKTMLILRRDFGDWFQFMALFVLIAHTLESRGVSIRPSEETACLLDAGCHIPVATPTN